jgi:hypothetical protein
MLLLLFLKETLPLILEVRVDMFSFVPFLLASGLAAFLASGVF